MNKPYTVIPRPEQAESNSLWAETSVKTSQARRILGKPSRVLNKRPTMANNGYCNEWYLVDKKGTVFLIYDRFNECRISNLVLYEEAHPEAELTALQTWFESEATRLVAASKKDHEG